MKICWLPALVFGLVANGHAVEYPGPAAGPAKVTQKSDTFTLSNKNLSVSWRVQNGKLALTGASNPLNAQKPLSGTREVFRLSTAAVPDSKVQDGFYLGWRLDSKNVTAVYGDGKTWRVIKAFPRSSFTGAPSILRAGKMNLAAEPVDYADAGAVGTSRIEDISPRDLGAPSITKSSREGTAVDYNEGTLKISAAANSGAIAQWPLKAGTEFVSARFWKDTDAGMSWGPGLALRWPDGKFTLVNARSPLGQFSVATQDGEELLTSLPPAQASYDLPASAFRLLGAPKVGRTKDGQEIVATFRHPVRPLDVEWRAILRNGSHYLRQKVTVKPTGDAGTLSNVEVIDFPVGGASQVGSVPGSPIAGANWFLGAELPNGANDFSDGARASVACNLPLKPGVSYDFGSVAGVYPSGQLRRSFLAYMERERARPTKPFLHYNGWYDFAQGVNEKDLNASIAAFHEEMAVKRGVQVDSYVIDDGWDDARNTFWGVDARKFPSGLSPVATELKKRNSHLGIWISPLGGYGEAALRTGNARKMGLVEGQQLDLSYEPYYKWFRDEHLRMMKEYEVNYFKWDKAGEGVTPHFLALARVANELRKADPNLYINVTVGTWPSPFWLNHIDSTWRGGADMFWIGAGNKREQWLNFRDAEMYSAVVKRAPLYPLNSMMHHGITIGQHYQGKEIAVAGADLKHDARSYFATGATLQELYLTPSMMTKEGWDEVATGAKWSKANFDVLADSHWIGGDPRKAEVYGYASWAPRKGIFMLRNPSDTAGTITLDAAQVFELPAGAKRNFTLSSPYSDQRIKSGTMRAGTPNTFTLEPFEVLVFEAAPQ